MLGSGSPVVAKSAYNSAFVPKEPIQCPAKVALEQICEHTLAHAIDFSKPAIS